MNYAEYLATWAARAKAAGYFDDLYTDDVEVNGSELEHHTHMAIHAWRSPTGLDSAGVDFRG